MWTWGSVLAAEPAANSSDSYIVVIGGIVVAALGTLGLVLVEVIKGRNSRTTASPPSPTSVPTGTGKDVELYERTAVLNVRVDDADDRHDLLERSVVHHIDNHHRRIVRIERHLGIAPEGE